MCGDIVSAVFKKLAGKVVVYRLDLLQQNNVWPRIIQPCGQRLRARLDATYKPEPT